MRTIVDLRSDEELAEDPPGRAAGRGRARVVLRQPTGGLRGGRAGRAQAAADHAAATREVYLIFLEHFRPNVAAAIRAVANAPEGGVVVHCHGGKDRTGLVSAFLLRLAGVPIEEIATDYSLSEERLRTRHEEWFAQAADEAELERLHRISKTPASSMVQVLEELERRYGSIAGYLEGRRSDGRGARARPARLRD